jgi:hypothetical protein
MTTLKTVPQKEKKRRHGSSKGSSLSRLRGETEQLLKYFCFHRELEMKKLITLPHAASKTHGTGIYNAISPIPAVPLLSAETTF